MPNRIDNIFSALADGSRRQILTMLTEKEMHVNGIAERFKFSRPAVSKHLKILQESRLVKSRRKGREHYYRLNAAPLNEVYKWLEHYSRFWDEKLQALKNYVENEI
jgi:DNA-binding transcriptional ArsR family regulator